MYSQKIKTTKWLKILEIFLANEKLFNKNNISITLTQIYYTNAVRWLNVIYMNEIDKYMDCKFKLSYKRCDTMRYDVYARHYLVSHFK